MKRFHSNALFLLVLMLSAACGRGPEAPDAATPEGGEPTLPPLRLTLAPVDPAYALAEARAGSVALVARFENLGEQDTLLAHPNICLPRKPAEGETLTVDPEQSRLSIRIEGPDGETRSFRYTQLKFFEPENRSHLHITAGESQEFTVSRLGPEFAMGQWEGIRQPVFDEKGTYRIALTYENAGPVAAITDDSGRANFVNVWTGDLESDPVTIEIE